MGRAALAVYAIAVLLALTGCSSEAQEELMSECPSDVEVGRNCQEAADNIQKELPSPELPASEKDAEVDTWCQTAERFRRCLPAECCKRTLPYELGRDFARKEFGLEDPTLQEFLATYNQHLVEEQLPCKQIATCLPTHEGGEHDGGEHACALSVLVIFFSSSVFS